MKRTILALLVGLATTTAPFDAVGQEKPEPPDPLYPVVGVLAYAGAALALSHGSEANHLERGVLVFGLLALSVRALLEGEADHERYLDEYALWSAAEAERTRNERVDAFVEQFDTVSFRVAMDLIADGGPELLLGHPSLRTIRHDKEEVPA